METDLFNMQIEVRPNHKVFNSNGIEFLSIIGGKNITDVVIPTSSIIFKGRVNCKYPNVTDVRKYVLHTALRFGLLLQISNIKNYYKGFIHYEIMCYDRVEMTDKGCPKCMCLLYLNLSKNIITCYNDNCNMR